TDRLAVFRDGTVRPAEHLPDRAESGMQHRVMRTPPDQVAIQVDEHRGAGVLDQCLLPKSRLCRRNAVTSTSAMKPIAAERGRDDKRPFAPIHSADPSPSRVS